MSHKAPRNTVLKSPSVREGCLLFSVFWHHTSQAISFHFKKVLSDPRLFGTRSAYIKESRPCPSRSNRRCWVKDGSSNGPFHGCKIEDERCLEKCNSKILLLHQTYWKAVTLTPVKGEGCLLFSVFWHHTSQAISFHFRKVLSYPRLFGTRSHT
jgi:hypothetical protein